MSEGQRERRVEINLDSGGRGTVTVDGHDFSNRVYKIELVGQVGKPNEVVLHMRAVEVKVMASAVVSTKMLMIDPDTADEAKEVSG